MGNRSSGITNRSMDVGDKAGPMPQSAHFQTKDEMIAELIARANSLPDGSTSKAAIEQKLEELGMVRIGSPHGTELNEWGNPK
jgi:hypothetical protein